MTERLADQAARGAVLVPAGRVVSGRLRVPPSKSYSNRYLALALLAQRPLRIRHLLEADDTRHFLAALETLGFAVARSEADVRL
ncbi:MAG: hypothetical protein R3190_08075, partial [Thermoanaerobaculia bacterium]|nr:hypothetical protein [Thermoanaerobaculia bacterium]